MYEDYEASETTVDRCRLDNFIVASTHGPIEINIPPSHYKYNSFMVLSHDHPGWPSTTH